MTEVSSKRKKKRIENSYTVDVNGGTEWLKMSLGRQNWGGNIFRGLTSRSTIILFCSTRPCITLLFPVTPAMTRDKRT